VQPVQYPLGACFILEPFLAQSHDFQSIQVNKTLCNYHSFPLCLTYLITIYKAHEREWVQSGAYDMGAYSSFAYTIGLTAGAWGMTSNPLGESISHYFSSMLCSYKGPLLLVSSEGIPAWLDSYNNTIVVSGRPVNTQTGAPYIFTENLVHQVPQLGRMATLHGRR